ncbi:PET domain [Trinorchestia longiramus]|nr:PET domain [Trinorchestia longiramus]
MVDRESIKPNRQDYIEKLEARLQRKNRLAHEIGAGAACLKCGDKCPGFELHYWRKICLNCHCSKDDHDIRDDDEDIGHIIIGKLFDRPDPIAEEDQAGDKGGFASGDTSASVALRKKKPKKVKAVILDLPDPKGVCIQQKLEWVPPNVNEDLAARYMTALPPEKRPIVGSEAAKERRQLLNQQIPLYDMDETQRCEQMPTEELAQFKTHLEHIRSKVVGQGQVSEVQMAPRLLVGQLGSGDAIHGPQHDRHGTLEGQSLGNAGGQRQLNNNGPFEHGSSSAPYIAGKDSYGIPGGAQMANSSDVELQRASYGPQGGDGYQHNKAPQFYVRDNTLLNSGQAKLGPDSRNNNASSKANRNSFLDDMIAGKVGDMNIHDQDPHSGGASTQLYSTDHGATPHGVPLVGHYKGGPQGYGPTDGAFVHSRAPVYDAVTGKLIPGNDAMYSTRIFIDPRTGLPVINPATGQPFTASQLMIDPATGQFLIDSRTWKPIQVIDPRTQKPVMDLATSQPFATGLFIMDPATDKPLINPVTNMPIIDPLTGRPLLDPATGNPIIDRDTKQPVIDVTTLEAVIEPKPGQLIIDPKTEQLVTNPNTRKPITNPKVELLLINPKTEMPIINPETGAPIIDPQTGLPLIDPHKKLPIMNPKTGMPTIDRETVLPFIDPKMGRPVIDSNTGLPIIDTETGMPIIDHTIRPETERGNRNSYEARRPGVHASQQPLGRAAEDVQLQSPAVAYTERLAGSSQLPTSSEVSVLLPHESDILKGRHGSHNAGAPLTSPHFCQQCLQPMIVGEVAVICERAGPQKFWHPNCFACYECGDLLADMIYFWYGNHIYCGRHYHQAANVPRCHGCDELIFSNSWTRAEDHDWHLSHFTCFLCDKPLAGESYVPSPTGHPYCIPCHMTANAQTCETCERKIEPGAKQCQFRGYHFHASDECFSCHHCLKPLLGGKFKMDKNWMFCSDYCHKTCSEELAKNPSTKFKHGDTEAK